MLNKAVVSLKSKRQVTVFVSFIVLITIIFVGKITAEVPPVREDISLRRLFEEVRDKGWIVFCARSDKGDWDLFTCRPDGNALQNITQIPEYNEAAHSFLDFACYVSFFPQLLSGPIQSYGTINAKSETTSTFADQLAGPTSSPSEFSYGAALFVLGFAKKVLLAEVAG